MGDIKWEVKTASINDSERWFAFTAVVQKDFCDMDLVDDENHRSGMMKNMSRGTAIYIEDNLQKEHPIIGSMTYSPNQNHISWLAVHPDYRKKGVASALMKFAICQLSDAKEIKVKTFLYDDKYGKAARAFYKKHGFIGKDILIEEEKYPHPVQVFVKTLK